jgi:predicted TIM-barrel fold metal-dependent hydrolase
MSAGYVDADGHVMEKAEELIQYLEEPWRSLEPVIPRRLLPTGDDFHTPRMRRKGIFIESVGPEDWLTYLEKTGLDLTVLYPTAALAHGYVVNPEWAVVYARAWNNYIHDKYLKRSRLFKAMAVIPMQDVSSAVLELRRAVKELEMVGAYIPSNGLRKHLSAKEFWPVYEEAERLDCPIGLHGGWYSDLGFNSFTRFPATRALGMPFPLAIAMSGMIQDGVWDAFPKLRIGFLEGGTSWIPLVIDRMERERVYGELRCEKPILEYFSSGRFCVGCEGNEAALSYVIERIGPQACMFASDFPHEIPVEDAMHEINEILERKDIKDKDKEMILGGNARRFYGL